MFKENDIADFIDKIINSNETKEKKEEIINQFHEYLVLTKMINNQTEELFKKVLSCLPEILSLKEKIGSVDILSIIKNKVDKDYQDKVLKKEYENRHYNHYSSSSTSNSCGSSSYTTDRC